MGFWPQTSGHNSLRWLKNNFTQEFINVSWHSLRYEPKHTLRHRTMLAVCRGDADALEKCIDEGWDIHATVDRRGRFSVLTLACHLDQLELVHLCDIKGANLLITKDGQVKLADFGVARKISESSQQQAAVVGTPYWMAPEVIQMSAFTTASDIWSLGCTILELLNVSYNRLSGLELDDLAASQVVPSQVIQEL